MLTTSILNAALALGVIVMVVAPLAWAIVTQHGDHPRPAAADVATVRPPDSQPGTRAPRPGRKPVRRRAPQATRSFIARHPSRGRS